MTNAIETAASMYTINSIVALVIMAVIVGYIAVGTICTVMEEQKFRQKFRRQFNRVRKVSK
jgi:hypothetical protein